MGWLVSLRGDDIAVGGQVSEASFPQRVLSDPKRAFQNVSVIGAAKRRWVAACEARRVP
jgi:hypothetical protein